MLAGDSTIVAKTLGLQFESAALAVWQVATLLTGIFHAKTRVA